MIRFLTVSIALVAMSFASFAQSQDMMGFERESFGSVVLSRTQAAGTDVELEMSIGNYENEPIINYSAGSVFAQIGRSVGRLDVLTDKGLFPCTAFIVSKKHILTNYHCSQGLLDNTKKRIGTSLFMLLPPIGIFAALQFYKKGFVDIKASLYIGLIFTIFASVSSSISIKMDINILRKLFGLFTIISGIYIFFSKE